jgi:hypothetical protein
MELNKIEQLLETLIDEIRELKQIIVIATEVDVKFLSKDINEIKYEVKNIGEELDWFAKETSFAKTILTVLERIESKKI